MASTKAALSTYGASHRVRLPWPLPPDRSQPAAVFRTRRWTTAAGGSAASAFISLYSVASRARQSLPDAFLSLVLEHWVGHLHAFAIFVALIMYCWHALIWILPMLLQPRPLSNSTGLGPSSMLLA